MAKSNLWTLLLVIFMAFAACTKDGNTIYQTNPDEEKPSTAPLVTVIYGPNGLGDRSYCDLIYKGVEEAAKKYGVRTLHLSPVSEEQGLAYLDRRVYSLFAPRVIPRIYVSDAQGIIRHMYVDIGMPTAEIIAENIKTINNK